jgi:GNAT superfamily N-acetyltransferase
VRQPERDARQRRCADLPPATGRIIDIRELTEAEVERIGDRLPLARLGGHQTYLVAWEGAEPVGHAAIAFEATKLGVPEIQDVFVREDRRGRGIGEAVMRAAEQIVGARDYSRVSISYGIANEVAKSLYAKLGYRDAGIAPQRVHGTIMVRGGPLEVDDTLVYLVKDLAVDSTRSRSS